MKQYWNNERALVYEGVTSTFYLILTQGPLLTAMALFFHLDVILLAVVSSFPLVFQVFQLITPWIIGRVKSRKRLLIAANSFRFVWIVVIAALIDNRRDPWMFVAVFAAAQAANAIAGNTWMSLVRDLVPEIHRSRFVGHRNAYISLVTVVLVFGYSWVIDTVPPPLNYIVVLSASLVGTLLSVLYLLPVDEKQAATPGKPARLGRIVKDRNFMKLCRAYFLWNGVIMISAPFFSYHQLTNLHLSLTLVSFSTVAMSLLSILFYRVWGRISDRMGNKSVLVFGILIVGTTPILWILMNDVTWPAAMVIDVLFASVGWAALNIAFIALPMEVSPDASPMYFALYFAAGGVGGVAGSLIGGISAEILSGLRFAFLGFHLYGIQLMFIGVGILRYLTILLFLRIETKRYVPPHTLVANVLSVVARRGPVRPYEATRLDIRKSIDAPG